MNLRILLLISFILLNTYCSLAQQKAAVSKTKKEKPARSFVFAGFSLNTGFPMNDFKEFQKRTGWGINGHFGYQFSAKFPLALCFDLGWMSFGQSSQQQTLTADIYAGNTLVDQLSFPLRITTSNNFLAGDLALRFMAPTTVIIPHIDVIGGFNNAWTATVIYDESSEHYFTEEDDNVITRKTQLSDFTWNYGGAAGFFIELNDMTRISIRACYMFGGEAKYYTTRQTNNWEVTFSNGIYPGKENLSEDDLDVNATPNKSKTDMLVFNVGFNWKFGIR